MLGFSVRFTNVAQTQLPQKTLSWLHLFVVPDHLSLRTQVVVGHALRRKYLNNLPIQHLLAGGDESIFSKVMAEQLDEEQFQEILHGRMSSDLLDRRLCQLEQCLKDHEYSVGSH